jgi:hypothetical protein
MRIIQRYKDVYDHIFFMYGQDPKIVWDRKTSQVENKLPNNHRWLAGRLTDGRTYHGQVLVVDNVVYVVYVDNTGKVLKGFNPGANWGRDSKIGEYLTELSTYTDKYLAPMVLVGTYVGDKGYPREGVFVNPQLNIQGESSKFNPEITVFRNVDHMAIFTGVTNWFSKHAKEPDMVELSDKDKLEKHGFDSKLSFRGKR